MWCDTFDGDLYRLVPDARRVLEPLAGVQLVTTMSTRPEGGKLNHPSAWNTYSGLAAFFGFHAPARPAAFVTGGQVFEVRCTFEEAMRDAWPHGLLVLVEQQHVWDAGALHAELFDLLADARGQVEPKGGPHVERMRASVLAAVMRATARFRAICETHGRLPAGVRPMHENGGESA